MRRIQQVQIPAVRRHTQRAAHRRGAPNGVLGITRDPSQRGAVIVHVNSGGNALECEQELRGAGYRVDPDDDPAAYGVKLRVRPAHHRAPEVSDL